MSKILYPVGTRVTIKRHVAGEAEDSVGQSGKVIEYIKLAQFPRDIDGYKMQYRVMLDGGRRLLCHVTELKREVASNRPQDDDVATGSAPVKSVSVEDVRKIVQDEVAKATTSLQRGIDNVDSHLCGDIESVRQEVVGVEESLLRQLEANKINEDA